MEGHLGAALFTRRAAGRTATPKLALGDTNFELAQTPVNPRRERMDDPEFQTDDARNVEPHKIQAKGTMIPILQDVETLKSRFEAMKGSGDPEKEKALDDITSACDLITHHVLDITEDAAGSKKARLFVRQAKSDIYDEVTLTVVLNRAALAEVQPLLEDLKTMGSQGCSRSIIIEDWSRENAEGKAVHGFDGDGPSKIKSIEVTKITKKDTTPKADKDPKGGDPENHRDPGCDAITAVMEEHKDDPGFRKDDFWDFCIVHNRADCDSGELENINEDEVHRLFDAFMAQKNKKARLFTRQADVKMHKTPPVGAPRPDQRTHLDQDLKDELNPKTDDPDLVRHTTGKSAATEAPLLEALSALVHKQWLGWSQGIAEEEDLTDERMERWEEECWMPYSQLSEEQKEKDRVEARQIIKLLKRRGIELKIEKEAGRLFA